MKRGAKLGTVLVAVDFSENSEAALARAALLPLRPGATIVLLHVLTDSSGDPREQEAKAHAALEERAASLKQALPVEDVTVRTAVERGRPHLEIVRAAAALQADLVVAGRRGAGRLRNMKLGSTADKFVRQGDRVVLLVARPPEGPYRRVGAAVELSELLPAVTTCALQLAGATGAPVEVLHAYSTHQQRWLRRSGLHEPDLMEYREQCRVQARDALAEALARAGIRGEAVHPAIRRGDPRRAIPRWAEHRQLELLALGTRGRGAFAELVLGSTTGEVMRAATCDVLLVPPSAVSAIAA